MAHWSELLRAKNSRAPTETIRFQAVTRGGRDWLILPVNGRLAARALALYPAQRRVPKFAKRLLGAAVRIKSPLKQQTLAVDVGSPFVAFLRQLTGRADGVPELAVLSGNPNVAGRRYAVLLFDPQGQPHIVVKAGTAADARALIRSEVAFLQQHPQLPGIAPLLDVFESPEASAFATKFVDGESPGADPPQALTQFLRNWIAGDERVPIGELAPWQRLRVGCAEMPLMRTLSDGVASRPVHPVVWHGDFAPWNIKHSRARGWVVFDWESSEIAGVPGWNWIHYVVSAGILIQRLSTDALRAKLEVLLNSEQFRAYAAETGTAGIEREIALSYLLYRSRIKQPIEGAEQIDALLAAMSTGAAARN